MIVEFHIDDYQWLSNMYPCKVLFEGVEYKSVEHAYMSAKSEDKEWKEFCRTEKSPLMVKNKSKKIQLSPEWTDERKLEVMAECLNRKFSLDNPELLDKLLTTGNENIQEGNRWGDTFWGVDLRENPNIGENHLGRLIMVIRDTRKYLKSASLFNT